MRRRTAPLQWLLAGLALMSAGVLLATGGGESGTRALIRATARSSALLLSLAFAARPLRQLWRSELSAWMLRERRALGLAWAASQAIHMSAILWWVRAYGGGAPATTWIVGGLGYAFAALMAITSTDAAVRRLGRPRWSLLHRTGMYVNVAITLLTLGGGVAAALAPLPVLALTLLLGACAVRVAAFATRGRRRAPA